MFSAKEYREQAARWRRLREHTNDLPTKQILCKMIKEAEAEAARLESETSSRIIAARPPFAN